MTVIFRNIFLLPDLSESEAFNIAERIRNFIQKSELIINDKVIMVTVSIGISRKRLLQKASKKTDNSLYEAKKSGKNVSTISSEQLI